MNIKQIILEEVEDFDWIRDIVPLKMDLKKRYSIIFDGNESDDVKRAVMIKLVSLGYTDANWYLQNAGGSIQWEDIKRLFLDEPNNISYSSDLNWDGEASVYTIVYSHDILNAI